MTDSAIESVPERPAVESPGRSRTGPESQLAVYGGPPAVTLKYRERWSQVRWRDWWGLFPYVLRGQNTLPRGGPIGRFEERFARLTSSCYAILMNSGTATLHSAFLAAGVKPGDEVIVPTYTWFATVAPLLQCGATPVFCDIDERTLTADVNDVERRITSRTRAICVVHIWGNPAAMDQFAELAQRHQLVLIEDASHAHGAHYHGRPVGSWGDMGCFSLQGSKAVSGGEAGVIVTNNAVYYDRMLALGHNLRWDDHATGIMDSVGMLSLGLKYRPHLCAAVLAISSLSRLPRLNALRERNYQILTEELADCPAVDTIQTYEMASRGGYLEFPLRYHPEHAGDWPREAFVRAARAEGVRVDVDRYTRVSETGQLLHTAPLFNTRDWSSFGGALSAVRYDVLPRDVRLPVAERLAGELMSMRAFTSVREEFVRQQARALRKVADAAARIRDLRTGE